MFTFCKARWARRKKTKKKITKLKWPKYQKLKDKNMGWTKQEFWQYLLKRNAGIMSKFWNCTYILMWYNETTCTIFSFFLFTQELVRQQKTWNICWILEWPISWTLRKMMLMSIPNAIRRKAFPTKASAAQTCPRPTLLSFLTKVWNSLTEPSASRVEKSLLIVYW